MDKFKASNGWYIVNGMAHAPGPLDSRVFPTNLPLDVALIEYGRHLERTEREAR